MATGLLDIQIDGVSRLVGQSISTPEDNLQFLWIGSSFSFGDPAQRTIRNIKVGTTGWGSTDVWNPALTSTADFNNGIFGAGAAALSVVGGLLTIASPPSGDAYGEQDLGSAYSDIYIELEYKHTVPGDGNGNFLNVFDTDFDDVDGFWINGSLVQPSGGLGYAAFPFAPASGVWQRIAYHYRWSPTVPLTVTPNAITITAPGSANVTITTDAAGWDVSDTDIVFTGSALPYGVTTFFSANPITPGDSATLTFTAIAGVGGGTFTYTLTGTGTAGDIHTAIITVTLVGDVILRHDSISAKRQMGPNLETVAVNAIYWTRHYCSGFPGDEQVWANPQMVLYEDALWVAWMQPSTSDAHVADSSRVCYVHSYDNATDSWVAHDPMPGIIAAGYLPQRFVGIPRIATDGTTLFLSFRVWYIAIPSIPPVYGANYVIFKYTPSGGWQFCSEQNFEVAPSAFSNLSHVVQDLAAFGGTAYLTAKGYFGQLVMDSDDNTYVGTPSYMVGGVPTFPELRVFAEGGTPLLLTIEPTSDPQTFDPDTGLSFKVWTLDGTLISETLEEDALGPYADRPLNMRWSVPSTNSPIGQATLHENLYYIDFGGPMLTLSADGTTVSQPFDVLEYAWRNSLSLGAPLWDDAYNRLWTFSPPEGTSAERAWTLQTPCAVDLIPRPLAWDEILKGDDIDQPLYIPGGINETIIHGNSVLLDNYIYTILIRHNDGGGLGGDDPFYNGHVQLWRSKICRGCTTCSTSASTQAVFRSRLRAESAGGVAASRGTSDAVFGSPRAFKSSDASPAGSPPEESNVFDGGPSHKMIPEEG